MVYISKVQLSTLNHSPYRILEDCGTAFAMGAIGGSLWHSIKGFKNSPRVME
jgi:import inner membrane translocase subunit TIM17